MDQPETQPSRSGSLTGNQQYQWVRPPGRERMMQWPFHWVWRRRASLMPGGSGRIAYNVGYRLEWRGWRAGG